MKKILALLLASVMVIGLFAACAPAAEETKTLKVAAIETAYGSQMWVDVCAAFEAQTGIKVELVTDKQLEDVIGPQIQGQTYPDVVHLATGRPAGLTEQLIKANGLHDLTNVLNMTVPGEDKKVSEKIAGGFTDTSLTNPYADGKTSWLLCSTLPAACSTTQSCSRLRAGPFPPLGTRCGSWATRLRLRASLCSLTPLPVTTTLSCTL